MRPIPVEPRYYYKLSRNSNRDGYNLHTTNSDPYDDERVRSEDHLLHQTLTQIFHEYSLTSEQVKELVTSDHTYDQDFIVKLILYWEPSLSEIFLQQNKLPLLWFVVMSCYQNSAELLVRSGADVNERCDQKRSTILHQLIRLMYPSTWNDRFIALLLEHGADIHARDSYKDTALYIAVKQGRVQVAKLLLEKGADVNVVSYEGKTLLYQAAYSGEADELVPLLIKHGADATVRDEEGMNALHHLALAPVEHVEAARVLIEKGVSLDDRDTCCCQDQPLHFAVVYEKNELVKLFLEYGADANARTLSSASPLHDASAIINNPAVVKTLLEGGAEVDLKTANGDTALHYACNSKYDRLEEVKILLSFGADVCVEDNYGYTPLSIIPNIQIANPLIKLMLKTLALKKACLVQPSIELMKDERIIKAYSELQTYYEECAEQIRKTKSRRFVESCTFFELLTKCHCQVAPLMRNPEFESKFSLCDLSEFSSYADEMRRNLERAKAFYQSMLKQEYIIDKAFCNIFPWMVMRKVAHYILDCEKCEMKKIVPASRSENSK